MSNRPADRALSKTETKQADEDPPDQPGKLTTPATPESGRASLLDRLKDFVVRPGVAACLGLLLLLVAIINDGVPMPEWLTNLVVPMTVAAFSWWLHLIARARQEKHEQAVLASKNAHEQALLASKNAHEQALQTRLEQLLEELQDREADLERDLEKQYQEFRRRLEDVRQDWQIKLAKQRDRMTARLSIASHVGDINGHLSAIEGILSAMPQEAPEESALESALGVIRIPERLLQLIHMPDSQHR